MSKLHEAPEEIFLQVDPEGDGPGELDTLDGATWCQDQINDNDVRYVRADLVKQPETETIMSGGKNGMRQGCDIDAKEVVRRMKDFGLKGVRDGSVRFFIKPDLLAEFVQSEILAEREACLKAIDEAANCGCGVPCDCFGAGTAKRAIKSRSNIGVTDLAPGK